MLIKNIYLENFRNYDKQQIDLNENINITRTQLEIYTEELSMRRRTLEREETILMIRALKQKMHIGTSIANLHCGHIMHKMETLVKVCH